MAEVTFISKPSHAFQKTMQVPGDKSLSHRALILGAIATGNTKIFGLLLAEDCMATIHALRQCGVTITITEGYVLVNGVGLYGLMESALAIDCQNSGTAMRLLSGLLSGQKKGFVLTGDASLSARPMGRIIDPLCAMGAKISGLDNKAPLTIQPTSKKLKGLTYTLPIASAQVKSCLLLAGLYSSDGVCIDENDISRDHLERMFSLFSYPLEIKEIDKYDAKGKLTQVGKRIILKPGKELVGTQVYIPGDISSAAFFIVAATLLKGSELIIENVGVNPTRTGLIDILMQMGAHIRLGRYREISNEPVADLYIKSANLKGITLSQAYVPRAIDEFPILFLAASLASGVTVLSGLSELRYKESDRLNVMSNALRTLGVQISVDEDRVEIQGLGPDKKLQGGQVDACGDHRIAMALTIAGSLASVPVTILNAQKINTSFLNFFETVNELGLKVESINVIKEKSNA